MRYKLELEMFNGNFSFTIKPNCLLESPYTIEDFALYDAAYEMVGKILKCVHLQINKEKNDIAITIDSNTIGLSDAALYGFTIHPEASIPLNAEYDDYIPVVHVLVEKAAFLGALNAKSHKIEDFCCWTLNIREVGHSL